MFLYDSESGEFNEVDSVSLDIFFQCLRDNRGIVALHCLTKEDIDRIVDSLGGSVGDLPDSFIWLDEYEYGN